jgi:hypothetical protein
MSKFEPNEENTDSETSEDFGIYIGEYSTKFEEIKNPDFINVINYLSEKYFGKIIFQRKVSIDIQMTEKTQIQRTENMMDTPSSDEMSDEDDFGVYIDNFSTKFEPIPKIPKTEFFQAVDYLSEKYLNTKKENQTLQTKSNEIQSTETKISEIQKPKSFRSTIFELLPSNIQKILIPQQKSELIYQKLKAQNLEYDVNDPNGVDHLINKETIFIDLKERLDEYKTIKDYDYKPKIMFTETRVTTTNKLLNNIAPSFINPYGLLHACIKIGPFVIFCSLKI